MSLKVVPGRPSPYENGALPLGQAESSNPTARHALTGEEASTVPFKYFHEDSVGTNNAASAKRATTNEHTKASNNFRDMAAIVTRLSKMISKKLPYRRPPAAF